MGKARRSVKPEISTILHLIGELVGLLDALEASNAVIVGHDWGAAIAWTAAIVRIAADF
jgi:pimeloyl-ACP methyl ester carboxylesterase